ncbi:tRNA pseudouridine(13) synthase TruD [Candidatus Thiodictyon syntrophicum]|jgi:tRNA pseudouridine13 synthase|uniref:tRNA pseudouridine synthase D n=1 Tax=Candidatus Thiodictyon syntrophicum TaxID=1166950 RepID=A0A2K8UBS7_9GAMM|nr:tRNA pseudouridine(13) synthase TruD [Candidatus Thiodictyon syntrophicum]AUB83038.1 tRNA pseudouridine(13) synthase TruD [Candidatus Thiodictyon syntrophicum]
MTHPTGPTWSPFHALPRAHGAPLGTGRLRVEPADFEVEEVLGFPPDGDGDHLLLWVRKTDQNTEWVAGRLAATAGVDPKDLGYAGLKDRRAVTSQWFSLPRPREREPDWSALAVEGIEVLAVHPHRRKLRRGALAGNRFRIRVRNWAPDPDRLAERITAIRTLGVPNYFGEQRFGRNGANLARADALFHGAIRRPSRHQQGLWLSAARSQVFNQVLAARLTRGDWDRPLPGDCLNLDGSHSWFPADTIDDTLRGRTARLDLHPTGPLWGRGDPPSQGEVRALEDAVAAAHPGWPAGLARFGLEQDRRALRLLVPDLGWDLTDRGCELAFELPAGAYATAVLRELMDWGQAGED